MNAEGPNPSFEEPDPAPHQPSPGRVGEQGGKEGGKVGLAILLWILGVPGLLVLAYLIFA